MKSEFGSDIINLYNESAFIFAQIPHINKINDDEKEHGLVSLEQPIYSERNREYYSLNTKWIETEEVSLLQIDL